MEAGDLVTSSDPLGEKLKTATILMQFGDFDQAITCLREVIGGNANKR